MSTYALVVSLIVSAALVIPAELIHAFGTKRHRAVANTVTAWVLAYWLVYAAMLSLLWLAQGGLG